MASQKKAQAAKDKGNASFKAGDYPTAIGHYTAAILADAKDPTFPLNRAAAYLKLGKNEDAERDCTTVLALSAYNVKALFRRGQARTEMGKLDEALQDFVEASTREPSNEAVKAGMKQVSELLEKKSARTSPSSPPRHPKRRRVPITIIDNDNVTPATSSPKPKSAIQKGSSKEAAPTASSSSSSDIMQPVSSRTLKPAAASKSIPSSSAPPPRPISPPAPIPKQEQPRTFIDAKKTRQGAKPSRVGGGIFRASGDSTIFPTRGEAATPPTEATTPSVQVATGSVPVPAVPQVKPTTLFDFSRAWYALSDPLQQWALISMLEPSGLPGLFKTSLEPALLVSILQVFRGVLGTGTVEMKRLVGEYMDNLSRVPRFGTLVLFLGREEKAVAREVLEGLGVKKEDVHVAWKAVW